jgi:hypothetical protein
MKQWANLGSAIDDQRWTIDDHDLMTACLGANPAYEWLMHEQGEIPFL